MNAVLATSFDGGSNKTTQPTPIDRLTSLGTIGDANHVDNTDYVGLLSPMYILTPSKGLGTLSSVVALDALYQSLIDCLA